MTGETEVLALVLACLPLLRDLTVGCSGGSRSPCPVDVTWPWPCRQRDTAGSEPRPQEASWISAHDPALLTFLRTSQRNPGRAFYLASGVPPWTQFDG